MCDKLCQSSFQIVFLCPNPSLVSYNIHLAGGWVDGGVANNAVMCCNESSNMIF